MRKPWLLNLLLLAALAVAGLRLSRFLQEPLPPLPEPPPAAAPGEPGAGAPGEPAAPAETAAGDAGEEGGGAGFDVIVARDLFSPTRGVVPPKPPPAGDAHPVAKPTPPPKLTLFGVVIVEGERSAYLQEGTGDAKPRKVREGEMIAGAKLKAIRPDGVTLTFAGSEITVALRTPKEGAAAASPAGAQPAAPPARGGVSGPAAAQPGVFPRRFQPGGAAPAIPQPGAQMPGVPRLLPPALDEEDLDEEGITEDDEEFIDEEALDEGDESAEEE